MTCYCDFTFMVRIFLFAWLFSPVIFDNTRIEYTTNYHVTIYVHIKAGKKQQRI